MAARPVLHVDAESVHGRRRNWCMFVLHVLVVEAGALVAVLSAYVLLALVGCHSADSSVRFVNLALNHCNCTLRAVVALALSSLVLSSCTVCFSYTLLRRPPCDATRARLVRLTLCIFAASVGCVWSLACISLVAAVIAAFALSIGTMVHVLTCRAALDRSGALGHVWLPVYVE